jgi:uncharacterized membrane protein YkoI
MDRRTRCIVGGALAVAVVGGGAGVAIANGAGDADERLTGSTRERASAAALEHTGGGTVIEAEAGDDGAAYGIEVRLPAGRVVEVTLDERFKVVAQQADDDSSNTSEPGDTQGE